MSEEPRPYTLVAELTYRCPLRCAYCSNPTDWARHADALTTDDWLRVFREAEALGVVQLNLTGGEPLLRDDLEQLVEGARRLDLYTNLITSGIPLARERLARLKALGLDNVQVSIQDVSAAESDRIAGARTFDRKLEVARWVKELGFPLTLNVVLHRDNLDRRAVDFGGCRCQAYHLTGDAAATDPACSLAPAHALVEAARAEALEPAASLTYRTARVAERA